MARHAKPKPVTLQPWIGFPPIDTDALSPQALDDDCLDRLNWLISVYGIDNTLEGWRELALRFVLDYCQHFFPLYRPELQTGGRPLDHERYFAHEALVDLANKMKLDAVKERKSTRVGSKAVAAFHAQLNGKRRKAIRGISEQYRGPAIGTLRNWLNIPLVSPEYIKRHDASAKIFATTK
jgi:hypothetical protein